ncbi:hypothetical protein HanXRQr2_Chr09g0370261 [Helianthus annuus]|uniref:Uncharacterized protein n=1 Tax=Helianthus annuus TaxID=4232 RepID=A0A9K3I3M2_HELAN|nr:hypothetical protein HanXRQr2_Chr16g0724431 [Helianthus annuus]KAF5789355.1 hypothetical protein HanXRQr2_Chr09g0370261 [Helianthus annuus]KAJ0884681.1 hypothetical protein HanPSC8_Chr10g0436651 [Helianthus annuus]
MTMEVCNRCTRSIVKRPFFIFHLLFIFEQPNATLGSCMQLVNNLLRPAINNQQILSESISLLVRIFLDSY